MKVSSRSLPWLLLAPATVISVLVVRAVGIPSISLAGGMTDGSSLASSTLQQSNKLIANILSQAMSVDKILDFSSQALEYLRLDGHPGNGVTPTGERIFVRADAPGGSVLLAVAEGAQGEKRVLIEVTNVQTAAYTDILGEACPSTLTIEYTTNTSMDDVISCRGCIDGNFHFTPTLFERILQQGLVQRGAMFRLKPDSADWNAITVRAYEGEDGQPHWQSSFDTPVPLQARLLPSPKTKYIALMLKECEDAVATVSNSNRPNKER